MTALTRLASKSLDSSWPSAARATFICGLIGLLASILNQYSADTFGPSLIRASVLASLLAVGLMLVGILWTVITPVITSRAIIGGEQGFNYSVNLPYSVMNELAWGSQMLLTATPAASLLIWWDKGVILRRGQISHTDFVPGPICTRARDKAHAISLVNLALYPGRHEFDGILENLPSVIVQPLGARGWLIIGGWSVRCFTRSDETWIRGWSEKIRVLLELLE
uniref:Cofactor assembly of complex C subunit B n=1 Tax=Paulinella chromatophora TaxID=39717 RepID=B1X3I3_PAUCH|nr:hypothetical protein PCC_0042 [Paulinella chromatophora]ACB42502.1 hypothetical protein PCC_0042 [Paulinella chromatophora]